VLLKFYQFFCYKLFYCVLAEIKYCSAIAIFAKSCTNYIFIPPNHLPMTIKPVSINSNIYFKIRFNTTHGGTGFYWRIIIGDEEYLACSLECKVGTRSDASFDSRAGVIKYHIVGECSELFINEAGHAVFS